MPLDQPYRGATADRDAPTRPRGIALPPDPLPMLHAGRIRKQWRYVGIFGPELSICVGHVHVGPFQQTFWATWERETGRLRERTYRRAAGVQLPPGRVIVRDGDVKIDLEFAEDPDGRDPGRIETVTPYGSGYAWTAKRGAVPIAGTVELDDVVHPIDALAMVDDSGGYPPRHTAWHWSAGIGQDEQRRTVAWNLVAGIHDDPRASERTLWIDGVPQQLEPVTFAPDLSAVDGDGVALRFTSEATRRRNENLLVVRSSYEQPFGCFSGQLPGGVTLDAGYGVMERHTATW